MRKRIFILGLGCLVFCLAGLKAVYAAGVLADPQDISPASQKKADDPQLWDFGRVEQGEVLKHDFVLKNESSDILEIGNIHTSCGCTASEAGKKSLMPLESTTISVDFKTQGYAGPVQQFVYVHTDSADYPIVKFTVKADIVKKE